MFFRHLNNGYLKSQVIDLPHFKLNESFKSLNSESIEFLVSFVFLRTCSDIYLLYFSFSRDLFPSSYSLLSFSHGFFLALAFSLLELMFFFFFQLPRKFKIKKLPCLGYVINYSLEHRDCIFIFFPFEYSFCYPSYELIRSVWNELKI